MGGHEMALWDRNDKLSRLRWLGEFDVAERQEKRARALGLPWPPFVVMGSRVFYSRQRTEEWFAEQSEKNAEREVTTSD
jgi:hypothetical protein